MARLLRFCMCLDWPKPMIGPRRKLATARGKGLWIENDLNALFGLINLVGPHHIF